MKISLFLATTVILLSQSLSASTTAYQCQSVRRYDLSANAIKSASYRSESISISVEKMRRGNGDLLIVSTDHSSPQNLFSFPLYTPQKLKSWGINQGVAKIVGNKQAIMNPNTLVGGGTSILETSCLVNSRMPCMGFSYYLYMSFYAQGPYPEGELFEYVCR